jgi:hypothetical protein
MCLYIHIPSYACWWRLMMMVIPATRMVMIMVVIVGLVTARQSKCHNKREESDADDVFYFVFHLDGVFG